MNKKLVLLAGIVLLGVCALYVLSEEHFFGAGPQGSSSAPQFSAVTMTPRTQGAQERVTPQKNAENPIVLYRSMPGWSGRTALDEIYARGVPQSKQSVDAVRSLLAQGVSGDEKVALARILGALYRQDDPLGENANILSELRKLSGDANGDAARMAVITYARLGYFNDSEALLESAYARGALHIDDYYGELAHLVDIAPPDKKVGLTEKIKASSNSYASDVLAMTLLGGQEGVEKYPTESLENISQLFKKTEPVFPSGLGEFGLFGAMRYSNWLRASAKIESQNSGRSADFEIINSLSQPNTDPRKVMAYLLTPEANSILAVAPLGSPVAGLVKIVNQYALQFPSNPSLQEYAQDIVRRSNIRSK
jgi:hypothetical protein